MTRVKRGTIKNKRRKAVLSATKGYRHGRKSKEARAKEAIHHAGAYAFAHRRDKKNDRRADWNVVINRAIREHDMSYSKLIGAMKKKGVALDRKVLADMAENHSESFKRLVTSL
jgi:large subunit ribosomal protein L20